MPVKRDALDALFSEVMRIAVNGCEAHGVRRRDGSSWVTSCGGETECCHVHTRRISRLRHDPDNIIVMCSAHHAFFTQHPLYWGDFVRDLRGDDHADMLIEKKQDLYFKLTKAVKADMRAHYREEKRRLIAERDSGATGILKVVGFL